jgi:hypothetical protein
MVKKKMRKTKGDSERMAIIETDIKYIKDQLSSLSRNLQDFIRSADSKYATKNELEAVQEDVIRHKESSQSWVKAAIPWFFASISTVLAIIVIVKGG